MSRVALVTGGTRGIGESISTKLSLKGYTVIANYAGNDQAANAFTERTGIATAKFDVSDFEATKAAIAKIESNVGNIEVLVNNAGITRDGTMHRMDFEQWNAVIQTNLSSCFNTCRAVIEICVPQALDALSISVQSMVKRANTAKSITLPLNQVFMDLLRR